MNETAIHQVFLCILGVAGILEYYGTRHRPAVWKKQSPRKRAFLGVTAGIVYVTQSLNAFGSLSGASSLELFGFLGCVLGCLASVRMMAIEDGPEAGVATGDRT